MKGVIVRRVSTMRRQSNSSSNRRLQEGIEFFYDSASQQGLCSQITPETVKNVDMIVGTVVNG